MGRKKHINVYSEKLTMYIHTTEISRHICIVVHVGHFLTASHGWEKQLLHYGKGGAMNLIEFDSANMMHKQDKVHASQV